MANTQLTKGNGRHLQRPTDVFGTMRNEMDRLFERFEHGWPRLPSLFTRGAEGSDMMPDLDVHENAQQFTIEADLPGVDEKDVTVTLANGVLCIKGEKKGAHEEKTESYYLAERSYGAFERTLRLPETIDDSKLEAKFDKGVLRIIAPKRPEAVKVEKKIEITKG
jgi:HSP20 family protein